MGAKGPLPILSPVAKATGIWSQSRSYNKAARRSNGIGHPRRGAPTGTDVRRNAGKTGLGGVESRLIGMTGAAGGERMGYMRRSVWAGLMGGLMAAVALEPATVAMVAMGAAAMVVRRRRR